MHIKCLGGPRDGEIISVKGEDYPEEVKLHDGQGGRVAYLATDEHAGPVELFRAPARIYVYGEPTTQEEPF